MGGGLLIAKKTTLNFRFHNPNTEEETANYILKLMIEVNQVKLDKILQQQEDNGSIYENDGESCSF